jgi:hypothetical protein
MKKAKQKAPTKKAPLDGYIAPRDPANVIQNTNPLPPALPDPQVAPTPTAAHRPVASPPAPGPLGSASPLVP